MTEPRAFTVEEARAAFLEQVRMRASFWAHLPNTTQEAACDGVVFSILNILDGSSSLPAMDIVLRPHPDDKEFLKDSGENWHEPGTVINGDVMLHEVYYRRRASGPQERK
jgi:hypothetical protein